MMLVRIKPEGREYLLEDLKSSMDLEGMLPRARIEISHGLISILPFSGPRKVGDLLIVMEPGSPVTFQVSGVERKLIPLFKEMGFVRVGKGIYSMDVDRVDAPVLLEIILEITALYDLGPKWMMNKHRFRRYKERDRT